MQLTRSRISLLVFAQVLLCWLEAYLISKISLIGKFGIATIHKEYKLLRSEWKTFLLLLSIQMAILIALYLIQKKYPRKVLTLMASILLILALIGLYITFQDFLHTYTHRLLKERFHLGFYLFWFGWIGTCVFFLATKSTGYPPAVIVPPGTAPLRESANTKDAASGITVLMPPASPDEPKE